MIFIVFLIILFSLGSFINHIYKPIVVLSVSLVFSHISARRQKLQTRAALLGSLMLLRRLKVLTAYGMSFPGKCTRLKVHLSAITGRGKITQHASPLSRNPLPRGWKWGTKSTPQLEA